MPRLAGLQLLRALAATMVLVGHVIAEAEHYFAVALPGDAIPWTRGVDIFFVISGFIITLSAQRFTGQPVAFLMRRALRVVPLYYLFTTLMVVVLLIIPDAAKDTRLDLGQILSSYMFFPYERADGRIAPVLSLGWTLNYEVFFYVLVAIGLALKRPFLWIVVALAGLGGVGVLHISANPQIAFWTNSILIEFLFGIALGRMWLAGWVKPDMIAAAIVSITGFLLLLALNDTSMPRFAAAGVPAALIVAGGTLLCPQRLLPFQMLGDASYALYLSHRFTLRAGTVLLVPLMPETPLSAAFYVVLICVLATAVGMLVHIGVERPMMRAFTLTQRKEAVA